MAFTTGQDGANEKSVYGLSSKVSPTYDGSDIERSTSGSVVGIVDHTHRKLKARHLQLIGIGGTIGTALYVQIGRGLLNGGPGSLFLAFTFWCSVILAVTLCMAEMVTYLPISSPFIRFADRYVHPAFGFAAGWNFFVFEAFLVPFEIVACSIIVKYWTDAIPTAAMVAIVTILYAAINLVSVKWYGETEFWAALGKVLLIVGLIIYTFITMLGGNPLGDRFGFRYWQTPGSFKPLYSELYGVNSTTYFLGFLQCLIQASFTIAGPDYVSMSAGECENPRKVMPKAFNGVFYRLTAFFVLGALCVGINVPYNDENLIAAFSNGRPGAAASPYVVAMNRLRIQVLPDIVNFLVLLSAFSAGNSYMYCASRSLFGMALDGKAPRIFARTNKAGVPYYSVFITLCFCLLAFLQVSAGSAKVLSWFVSLITASQLLNFSVMCVTYLFWYRALKAQGISRDTLPYKAILMPGAAYYGLFWCFMMAFVGGYTVFLPGYWAASDFIFSYFMIGLFPVLFVGWAVVKKAKFHKPETTDLVGEVAEIEEYTRNFVEKPYRNKADKYFNVVFGA